MDFWQIYGKTHEKRGYRTLQNLCNPLILLVGGNGFEPSTSGM
jgi:hypothetical protein